MFVITKNVGMKVNVDENVKNRLTKEYLIKKFIWNPSNCKCECDKSCDFGEYLDHENCMCRKK